MLLPASIMTEYLPPAATTAKAPSAVIPRITENGTLANMLKSKFGISTN